MLSGVTGRSPLPSGRTVNSRPPKTGPGTRRMKAIVPEGAAWLVTAPVASATAAPASSARTVSLDIGRRVETRA